MNVLLAAIHGILTSQTDASWPDQLDAWASRCDPAVRVLKKEYAAGPFPRWNCWLKNPRVCRGLAAEILLFRKRGPGRPPRIWIVAHSNGAVIALGTLRRLFAQGCTVDGVILIGAACDSNIDRTAVREWIQTGKLGMAIAYCSADDHVLPGAKPGGVKSWIYRQLAWPYGSLGRTGWTPRETRLGSASRPRLLTRWFAGGHSGYFAPGRIEYTFRQILQDVRL